MMVVASAVILIVAGIIIWRVFLQRQVFLTALWRQWPNRKVTIPRLRPRPLDTFLKSACAKVTLSTPETRSPFLTTTRFVRVRIRLAPLFRGGSKGQGRTGANRRSSGTVTAEPIAGRPVQTRHGRPRTASRSRAGYRAIRPGAAGGRLSDRRVDKDAYTRLAKSGAVSERQGLQASTTADQQAAAVAASKRRVEAAQAALTTATGQPVKSSIRESQVVVEAIAQLSGVATHGSAAQCLRLRNLRFTDAGIWTGWPVRRQCGLRRLNTALGSSYCAAC